MRNILHIIGRLLYRLECLISRASLAELKYTGEGVALGKGVKIEHPEYVSLGDCVHINDYCWLSIVDKNSEFSQSIPDGEPELTIGSGTYIGRFGTLACVNRIIIGDDVLISDRVFIGDAEHGFLLTSVAIKDQKISSPGPVIIGDGTWVGIGVSILPNVKIGKNCVIGANSVVTRDIPDFSVAIGNPAKVVRCLGEQL